MKNSVILFVSLSRTCVRRCLSCHAIVTIATLLFPYVLLNSLIFLASTKRNLIASFTNTADRRVLGYYSGDSPEDAFDM